MCLWRKGVLSLVLYTQNQMVKTEMIFEKLFTIRQMSSNILPAIFFQVVHHGYIEQTEINYWHKIITKCFVSVSVKKIKKEMRKMTKRKGKSKGI